MRGAQSRLSRVGWKACRLSACEGGCPGSPGGGLVYSLGRPSGQGPLSQDPEVRASPRVEGPLTPPIPAVQASSALRGATHLELRDRLPALQPRPSAGSPGLPWAHRAFWQDAREPLSSRPGGLVGASEASLHVGWRVGHTEPGLVGTTGPDTRAWAMVCECRWGPGGCADASLPGTAL